MDERPPMERAMSTVVVLDIVMSRLKVRDLLSCRKVSKFWNQAASSSFRKRSTMTKLISKKKTLMRLEENLKQSSDFPFAGLQIEMSWNLNSVDVTEFFKKYGGEFTSLHLCAPKWSRIRDLALFLNHLPRLSVLEVEISWEHSPYAGVASHAVGQEDGGRILNLPCLRTLRIISSEINQDILRQVCSAAPSLQIECPNATYAILRALKNIGKLQAVSVIEVFRGCEDKSDALRLDNLLSNEMPALTKLDFSARRCISRSGLIALLMSSQHTLKDLVLSGIYPSEISSECPVLPKLTTLSLYILDQPYEYIFQGSHGHKFPKLKQLEIFAMYNPSIQNLSDGMFIVPSLATINLDHYVDKDGIENLALSFPNVIEIRLNYRHYGNEPSEIWSVGAFTFLEKLRIWDYPVLRPTKNYMDLDSFLTGIPTSICKNLCKQAQLNLLDSPLNDILRDSPSLLQLKNLKELILCVSPELEQGLEELPKGPSFISMVSVWYALQMMPNLQAKFLYDYSTSSWFLSDRERDKAVKMLKAAFKHVQPYVKLEPFFY